MHIYICIYVHIYPYIMKTLKIIILKCFINPFLNPNRCHECPVSNHSQDLHVKKAKNELDMDFSGMLARLAVRTHMYAHIYMYICSAAADGAVNTFPTTQFMFRKPPF